MQAITTLTAKEFTAMSLIGDLKELCGQQFELVSPQARKTILATLTMFQFLKTLEMPYFTWELMDEAMSLMPSVAWAFQQEIKERLFKCWQLDDGAIQHLIQRVAENL